MSTELDILSADPDDVVTFATALQSKRKPKILKLIVQRLSSLRGRQAGNALTIASLLLPSTDEGTLEDFVAAALALNEAEKEDAYVTFGLAMTISGLAWSRLPSSAEVRVVCFDILASLRGDVLPATTRSLVARVLPLFRSRFERISGENIEVESC